MGGGLKVRQTGDRPDQVDLSSWVNRYREGRVCLGMCVGGDFSRQEGDSSVLAIGEELAALLDHRRYGDTAPAMTVTEPSFGRGGCMITVMSCNQGADMGGAGWFPATSCSRRFLVRMAPVAIAAALVPRGRARTTVAQPVDAPGHRMEDGAAASASRGPVGACTLAGAHLAAWSPDACHIAGLASSLVRVWNSAGDLTVEYSGHTDEVLSAAWAPDSRCLASAGFDGTVQVWKASCGETLLTYQAHEGWVRDVQWAPDGQRVASAGYDRTVRVWDTATGVTVAVNTEHEDDICAITWSPDGTRLASTDSSGITQVWFVA